jgi:hypothetical protein
MISTPKNLICTNLALSSSPPEDGKYFFIVFTPIEETWELSSQAEFVTVLAPTSQPGLTIWPLQVTTNRDGQRTGTLQLRGQGQQFPVPVSQAGGAWVEDQVTQVLSPPNTTVRSKFPLAMELGAAGKFIGEQLKKLPPPAKAAALALLPIIITGLGSIVIMVRAGFSTVPEPPNYFTSDPDLITVQLIDQQTKWLIQYITEQTLA